jgi:class 3 adenylate cyclase
VLIALGDLDVAWERGPILCRRVVGAVGRLPTGTVTFLFTDLERSTTLWEQQSGSMHAALARHDELVASEIAHGRHRVRPWPEDIAMRKRAA